MTSSSPTGGSGDALSRFVENERPPLEATIRTGVGSLKGALGAAAAYAIGAGGKRFRPLLTMACYDAADPSSRAKRSRDEARRIASATEFVHTYSLLHDDLPCMDDDGLRRGLPTTHLVYGTPIAVAAGLAMQQLAFLTLTEPVRETTPDLLRELARAVGGEGMVGGQAMDLEAEGIELDLAALEAIHRSKTSALIAAACALGGLAAGADPDVTAGLRRYGAALGLAFQIADDVLDVIGDPASTGKPVGSDAGRSKATYPSVHGVEGAMRQAQHAVEAARSELSIALGDRSVLEGFAGYAVTRIH